MRDKVSQREGRNAPPFLLHRDVAKVEALKYEPMQVRCGLPNIQIGGKPIIILSKLIIMLVEIKEKSVYGGTLLYPNNQTAVYLTELMNKKTFNIRDLDILTDLGYTINIIKL